MFGVLYSWVGVVEYCKAVSFVLQQGALPEERLLENVVGDFLSRSMVNRLCLWMCVWGGHARYLRLCYWCAGLVAFLANMTMGPRISRSTVERQQDLGDVENPSLLNNSVSRCLHEQQMRD